MEKWWNDTDSTQRKACPSVTLSTTNPTQNLVWDRTKASVVEGRQIIT